MKMRFMGITGIKVSEICVGAMTPDEVKSLDALSTPPRVYPYWMLERNLQER